MWNACRQVNPVSGLKLDLARWWIGEFNFKSAAQDPQALILFVAVSWVDGSRHVVPAKTFIAFLMQTSLGLDFGGWQVVFFTDDPDAFRKVHVSSAARSSRVAERLDGRFALAPKLARKLADLIEVFEKLRLPAFAAFKGFVLQALGVEVELRDGCRKSVGLKDGQVFFAIKVERVLGLRVVHKWLKGYPILSEKKRTPAQGSSSGRGRN